ncbi:sensor histidine kinase [Halodurantibacterium flavum]|uniref:histidine kinase n=1 Tax=Halodurantibacterium flavum TaxID=1382802 RepID=A0ABW4SA42_9RHOB
MKRHRANLRLRLMLGAASLAALAVLAAGIAVHGLARAEGHAASAIAAQGRMEAYAALSSRVNERVTASLARPPDATGATPPEEAAVAHAFAALERMIAADVAEAHDTAEADRRAAPALLLARAQAQFRQLSRALDRYPPGSDGARAALSLYALQVPPLLSEQIELERRRRDAAMSALSRLRRDLGGYAIAVAVAAPATLLCLWLLLLRPLARRLRQATAGAEHLALAGGDRDEPGDEPGDELSLLFARMRQMARRLDRRRARLETLVADRTARLQEANARLARTDAERRRFFADVSHELRTPLTVILGEAELGMRGAPDPWATAFVTIRSRARRLFRRIEDLLRIARSESGQLDLDRRPVALAPLIEAALEDLRPLIAQMRIDRRIAPGAVVTGDPEWLRQVAAGLIENAAKYAGARARLQITASVTQGMVTLRFCDDGPGLGPHLLDHVTERFGRGDAGAATPGFGVGLALARWVIEAHGGTLALGSSDRGLCVAIRLPQAAQSLLTEPEDMSCLTS